MSKPRLNIEINPQIKDALKDYCDHEGRSMKWVTEKALGDFLDLGAVSPGDDEPNQVIIESP